MVNQDPFIKAEKSVSRIGIITARENYSDVWEIYALLSVFNAPINQHTIESTTIIQQRYQTLYKHFFLFNQSNCQ